MPSAKIENNLFFDKFVKNKHKACEKLVEKSKNNDCATGYLLDYSNQLNYHELIDLSRQQTPLFLIKLRPQECYKKVMMNIVNDQSKANYSVGNEIMFRTEVLKSNVYDFNDTYIIVRGNITAIGRNDAILSSI